MLTNQTSLAQPVPTQLPKAGMLCVSNLAGIKAYFLKVREMAKSGVHYPANLNDVWSLVYSRKGDAVRALVNDFEQEFDYQPLRKNAKRTKGGQNETDYELTVSCMEFFIARKIRAVFEVYREVFHWVADNAVHVPQSGLIQLVNDLTDRVLGMEGKMERMRKAQDKYFEVKATTQFNQDAIGLQYRRDKMMGMLTVIIRRTNGFSWTGFWDDFAKHYAVDIRTLPHKPGEHYLDVAIRHGHIERVWEMLNWQ